MPSSPESFSLADAVEIATRAHEGQLDKAGLPYIRHPLRVMDQVEGEWHKMAAVLHDVVEDTGVTAEDLRAAGCPERVVTAVLALSKGPDEPMESYLRRAAEDEIAIVVKHADIADNSGPERLGRLDQATQDRLRAKYARALSLLTKYRAEQT
ncbi:phosphohydrolase [Crossiella sp. CA-258035]|uniref:phosphohydrolase n=1 Tax=Crossiella sp. CA-258035 TaxID=2981138 RepID=UPI0024BCA789|nr:phosphohydrolase [Crossiella sp. CA-258035]WHT20874.1 phosphohydrolase [Crossiella sp. CA-258035]